MRPFDIQIANFRSIRLADMTVDHIALVLGKNTTGKSSICNAIAATMLGQHDVYGATKADQSGVITEGEKVSSVVIKSSDQHSPGAWMASATWPGEIHTEGRVDLANEVTMGLVSPVEFDRKQWAGFIRNMAPTPITLGWNDVIDELMKLGNKDNAEDDLTTIRDALRSGWDAATDVAKQNKLVHRRAWERITGEKFGEKKIEDWQASGWDGSLPGDHTNAIRELDELRAASTAGADVAGQSKAQLMQDNVQLKVNHENGLAKAKAISEELHMVMNEIRKFQNPDPLKCPCCQATLRVMKGQNGPYLVEETTKPRFLRGSKEHVDLTVRADNLNTQLLEQNGLNFKAEAAIKANDALIAQIEARKNASVEGYDESLHQDLVKASEAAKTTYDAAEAAKRWKFFNDAEHVCGPLGVRMMATRTASDEVQIMIDDLAEALLPGVTLKLEDDGEGGIELLWNGKPYKQMVWKDDPNSYRLMLQIVFQIIALFTLQTQRDDDNGFIIIDRFDTLDMKRRGAVLGFLRQAVIAAVIAQTTATSPEQDKLDRAKIGKTYWIGEDGIVKAV